MDFHLPKVPHSWRELAREIGIIVLGVLIALFFEQLVQRWDWMAKVRAADKAMRAELLQDDGPQIYMDAAIHPCVVARLDAIRSAVEAGRPRPDVAKLISDFWTPLLTYDSSAHAAAESSQVTFYFDPKQLYPFTQVYESIPLMNQTGVIQARDAAGLKAFRRTGEPLSAAEGDRVLTKVEQLRNDDRMMWYAAQFTLPLIREIGPLDPAYTQVSLHMARRHYGTCVKDLPPNFPAGVPSSDLD